MLAVCREALSNIARHSGASAAAVTPHARIQVLLRFTDSAGALGEITPARGCGRSRLPLSAQGRPAPPDGLPFSLPRGELPPKERQAGQHAGTQQRRKGGGRGYRRDVDRLACYLDWLQRPAGRPDASTHSITVRPARAPGGAMTCPACLAPSGAVYRAGTGSSYLA